MSFSGFERGQVSFLRQLVRRQDREWFQEHRQDFLELCEAPLRELLDDLRPALERQYKGRPLAPTKIFRIHRDLRFAKDKRPFKSGTSGMILLAGEDRPAAMYVEFGTEDYAGAGHWWLPPDRLARYRALLADGKTGGEVQRRVDGLLAKGFQLDAMESVKRVPPGFAADHPRARLLKLKGLGIGFPKIPAAVRFSPRLSKWLQERSAEAARLVSWLEDRLDTTAS